MASFSFMDINEGQKELFEFADKAAIVILVVVLLAVILWVSYCLITAKNARPKPHKRCEKDYTETEGIITGVKKVNYSVVPYRKKKLHIEDLNENKLFGKKKAEQKRKEREKYQKEYLSPAEENPEPIEKVRYDVEYEFCVQNDDCIYVGEFSFYGENNEPVEGNAVTVMYNSKKPTENYLKHNSPSGRC